MNEPVTPGSTRKLFSRTYKPKTWGAPGAPDSSHSRTKNNMSSNTPEIWPYQMTMFGLPSLPRPGPKARKIGRPLVSSSVPTMSSSALATSPPTVQNPRQQPDIAELEAPGASFPTCHNQHSSNPVSLKELSATKFEPAELEAPRLSTPGQARSHPKPSASPILSPEVPLLPASPPYTAPSDPLELCSHQGVADQPSNGVYNILKEMSTPLQDTRGGYVYFSADANAHGLLKLGYTETWDEPWVLAIPDNVVFCPDLRQSNSLGKRIRQRKSTCGLWPVIKLVAPMKHAGRKMERLVRSTLVDNKNESVDGSAPELFSCTLLQAERVLRLWQRFSNLQPFTSSGQLEAIWGKYAKDGLRGRWNIYSIEKWLSTSLEPVLGKLERGRGSAKIRESFEPDQWIALQVIIGTLGEKDLII